MSRRWIGWTLALVGATGALGIACTLNPQPLPPDSLNGEGSNSGAGGDGKNDPSATTPGGGSTGLGGDAGQSADASTDSPPPNQQDGGDAGDAAVDAPLDASNDSATGD